MDPYAIKDLGTEQRDRLRKLLSKTPSPVPQYRVKVEFWDRDKTQIKRLREYLGDQLHGAWKRWYRDGQLQFDFRYQNGKEHGGLEELGS